MAISPDKWEHLAEEIRDLYGRVADDLLATIGKMVTRGIDAPDYLIKRLQEATEIQKKTQALIEELRTEGQRKIEKFIETAYLSGMASVDEDLKSINIAASILGSVEVQGDIRAIAVLISALSGKLEETHVLMIRSVQDTYRRIIYEVSSEAMAGAGTRLQAAQKALNRFADQGITGYTAKNGARWEIETYAEMATRSAIGQASIEGHIERQRSYDRQARANGLNLDLDLVSVSNHPEECEKCRPWEGRILSIDNSDKYPTLQEAREAGLFHPRCGHRLHTYVEGITPKPPKAKPDPTGYKERQHQRYLERQIRFWKKRKLVAVTDKEKTLTNAKVREWQGRMREWIKDKDRYRRYEREKVVGAR